MYNKFSAHHVKYLKAKQLKSQGEKQAKVHEEGSQHWLQAPMPEAGKHYFVLIINKYVYTHGLILKVT